MKQRGAVEACWAHNSEVGGSKPFAASFFIFFIFEIVDLLNFNSKLNYNYKTCLSKI
jgi:hypothetical protein